MHLTSEQWKSISCTRAGIVAVLYRLWLVGFCGSRMMAEEVGLAQYVRCSRGGEACCYREGAQKQGELYPGKLEGLPFGAENLHRNRVETCQGR